MELQIFIFVSCFVIAWYIGYEVGVHHARETYRKELEKYRIEPKSKFPFKVKPE